MMQNSNLLVKNEAIVDIIVICDKNFKFTT